MKKHLLLILSVVGLSATGLFAQNIFPSSGNVGIGTSSPVGNLDIFDTRNTANTPLISVRSNFHVIGNYGMIKFGDYTQTTDYQKGAIIYESVEGSARGKFHIALENTDSPGSVTLADARFTVLSNGNIGIGTVNPDNKLSANGTIRAREVKVENTNWPDYVFAPDYKVLSLSEVAKYIQENKHLPGMPSAQEIATQGISVSEMFKLQQQKIEELTLYLIEKDRKIDALIKRVEQLEDQKK